MFTKTKRILGLFLALIMLISGSVFADTAEIKAGYDMVSVRVDGKYINAPTYLYNDYVYLPLRAVSEAMGAEVLWDGATNAITITTNQTEPKIQPRSFAVNPGEDVSFEAHVNYVKVFIDGNEQMVPHFLYNGTTYVPVSIFDEMFGCHVMQHLDTMSVRIYSPDYKTFGENEVFYVNDTPYTNEEANDISKMLFGVATPSTLADYANVEEYLLSGAAMTIIGEQISSKDGFTEYYQAQDFERLIKDFEIADRESFIENVAWPFYYSQSFGNATLSNYFNPTDEDLAAYLPNTIYAQGRWLKAKHILFEKTQDGSGLKLAEDTLATLKENPEQFDMLMATYSEDPGSIAKPDGYLFTEGDMVDAFYEGTLPLQVGEISGIVESEFGYHIILKVADYENGVPLEEVKDEIKSAYLDDAISDLFVKQMAEIDTVLNHTVISE